MDEWLDSGREAAAAAFWRTCSIPVLRHVLRTIFPQIFVCVAFGIIARLARNELTYNLMSALLGTAIVFYYDIQLFITLIVCVYGSYIFMQVLIFWADHHRVTWDLAIPYGIFSIIILFNCELNNPYLMTDWGVGRPMLITAMMKVFSITASLYLGDDFPSLAEYSGYLFCPANLLLGPWVSFEEYCEFYKEKSKNRWNWRRLVMIVACIIISVFCAWLVGCALTQMIPFTTGRFYVALRQALAFRVAHYARCFAATALMLGAGFNNHEQRDKGHWYYVICKPFQVEWPICIVSAAIAFDVPTFVFLNEFVYSIVIHRMHIFFVLSSYIMSCFLHQPNIEAIIAPITLACFAWIQVRFRKAFARRFSICADVFKCKEECTHQHRLGEIVATGANIIFTLVAIILIAYATLVIDEVGFLEAKGVHGTVVEKWNYVYFYGHHLILISFVSTLFLR